MEVKIIESGQTVRVMRGPFLLGAYSGPGRKRRALARYADARSMERAKGQR